MKRPSLISMDEVYTWSGGRAAPLATLLQRVREQYGEMPGLKPGTFDLSDLQA
jgi:hypothetical protein